jgi:hypothetical protein
MQNAELLIVEPGGTCSYQCALKFKHGRNVSGMKENNEYKVK